MPFEAFMKTFYLLGAIFAFFGVAAGAFGAHALKSRLSPEYLSVFEVGVRYQMYHALALLILPTLSLPAIYLSLAGWFLTSGIVLFSGSLYILALTSVSAWGAVTPIGGLLLLAGWASIIVGLLK